VLVVFRCVSLSDVGGWTVEESGVIPHTKETKETPSIAASLSNAQQIFCYW
jgi:hypothetical protein